MNKRRPPPKKKPSRTKKSAKIDRKKPGRGNGFLRNPLEPLFSAKLTPNIMDDVLIPHIRNAMKSKGGVMRDIHAAFRRQTGSHVGIRLFTRWYNEYLNRIEPAREM